MVAFSTLSLHEFPLESVIQSWRGAATKFGVPKIHSPDCRSKYSGSSRWAASVSADRARYEPAPSIARRQCCKRDIAVSNCGWNLK